MSVDEAFRVLGLSPSASDREVRLAYLDLMKVWHPDRFRSDERLRGKAETQVKLFNQSYQILKSVRTAGEYAKPYQSRNYQQPEGARKPQTPSTDKSTYRPSRPSPSQAPRRAVLRSLIDRIGQKFSRPLAFLLTIVFALCVLMYVVVMALSDQTSQVNPLPKGAANSTIPTAPLTIRTLSSGTRIRRDLGTKGHGILTVENESSEDAVVKVSDSNTRLLVRYIYLQQGSKIDMDGITPGEYRIRFMFGEDWDGSSQSFTRNQSYFEFGKILDFTETQTPQSIIYSHESITLNTVQDGNVRREELSKQQFLEDQ